MHRLILVPYSEKCRHDREFGCFYQDQRPKTVQKIKLDSTRLDSTESFTRLGSTRHASKKHLTRLDPSRVESSRRVSIQNRMFRSTFLISRMRRNSGINFTRIMVLKHQSRTIRKANGQLQEIATISWKQYLRFEDLRFFSVYSHQNLVFIAQRRLEVIDKVLCSLHSMYCFYFLSIFRRLSIRRGHFLRVSYSVPELGMIVLNSSRSSPCTTSKILQVDFFCP